MPQLKKKKKYVINTDSRKLNADKGKVAGSAAKLYMNESKTKTHIKSERDF